MCYLQSPPLIFPRQTLLRQQVVHWKGRVMPLSHCRSDVPPSEKGSVMRERWKPGHLPYTAWRVLTSGFSQLHVFSFFSTHFGFIWGKIKQMKEQLAPTENCFPQSFLGNDTAALFFKGILVFWNSLHQGIISRTFFDVVLYFFRTFRHLKYKKRGGGVKRNKLGQGYWTLPLANCEL